ncbi:hypothetical protein [Rubripirellula lacrimiformis]|uniref:hypothetical protein n=1 Tax=Rubripirellula lacrimiformis TaxID=1930273 RepID=UPI00119E17FB|nr:hypothetical protein [Rubripirellula lacrimiformis]
MPEFWNQTAQSGSRMMTNPFVVEMEATPFERDLNAIAQVLTRVDVLSRDPSMPRWRRCASAIQLLSLPDYGRLPQSIQSLLQSRFNAINSILSRYSLKSGSDFQQLSDLDAQRIQKQLQEIAAIDLRFDQKTQ